MIATAYFFIRNKLFYKKNILQHPNTKIFGVQNIISPKGLEIGMNYVGFTHNKDVTLLNINGTLNLKGFYTIGIGCRFDIAPNAIVQIGSGGYINPFSKIIINNGLQIGDNCIISWECQFLDEDFHTISYEGKRNKNNSIVIGNNVWIGSGVKILSGSIIPDNCVIAAYSIIKGQFDEKNCLIGGHPAIIIKRNIHWN